jgi:hypothetical protein
MTLMCAALACGAKTGLTGAGGIPDVVEVDATALQDAAPTTEDVPPSDDSSSDGDGKGADDGGSGDAGQDGSSHAIPEGGVVEVGFAETSADAWLDVTVIGPTDTGPDAILDGRPYCIPACGGGCTSNGDCCNGMTCLIAQGGLTGLCGACVPPSVRAQ